MIILALVLLQAAGMSNIANLKVYKLFPSFRFYRTLTSPKCD